MIAMGSLFDGIGGFPLAAVRNGITPLWASEIEAFPIEVTKIRFPEMLHVGDITKLDGAKLPTVDVICGGSPCQDLSVAGARRGLAGERSGLFMEQTRITKEMRKADGARGIPANLIRPRYLVWENVPGAFSSADGEDFRAVLEEIVRIKVGTAHVPRPDGGCWQSAGAILLGDEFSLAWRVLDAQHWGVAQRRRRIFLVADFGGLTAPEILFKQDRLLGDFTQSRGPWQGAAAPASGGVDDSSGACLTPWDVQSRRIFEETGTWPTLYGGDGGGHGYIKTEEKTVIAFAANQRDELRNLHDIAGALGAQPGMKQQTFVAEPLLCLNDHGGERMDITEEITPTLRAGMGGHPPLISQPSHVFAAGVVSKGDGDCFLTPETHTSLTGGGGQAGQGYPCVLTAAFCGSASADARGIGYQDECSPTLKTGTAPSVLCLNDQGGSVMNCSEDVVGTLRAQEHGHQPLVFDNHGQDARFIGPVGVSQTVSAGFGMGGNNQPLVMATQQGGAEIGEGVCPTITASAGMSGNNQPVLFEPPIAFSLDAKESNSMKSSNPHSGCRQTDTSRTIDTGNPDPSKNQGGIAILQEAICIAGNTIDRQPQNGGNGLGCQSDIAYTLTSTDRHSICEPYQEVIGALCSGDEKGIGNQYVSQDKCIVEKRNLIRRLTPLECERLQGFPDGWTFIPGCSDSARYKSLGNSVAIPCVEFLMRGIAYFLRQIYEEQEEEDV